MAKRTCFGCDIELTGDVATLEDILPKWLAALIRQPNVRLNHFLHDETKAEDKVVRSHDLNTFKSRQVCARCNNGWMSRLETQAKPVLLPLMHLEKSILMLTDDERRILSRWAVKTAFMISTSQTIKFTLPLDIFRALGKDEASGPNDCFVFANQQQNLPKGFLYTSPADHLGDEIPIQLRLGFSLDHLHFVTVIPLDKEPRIARIAAGIHTPLWPLNAGVFACYKSVPTALPTASAYLDFLTNLIEVGVLRKQGAVEFEFVR